MGDRLGTPGAVGSLVFLKFFFLLIFVQNVLSPLSAVFAVFQILINLNFVDKIQWYRCALKDNVIMNEFA